MGGAVRGRKLSAVVNDALLRLDLRETIQRMMFLGIYEPIQTEWFKQCLGANDTVIDVGASFGYYTTLAAQLVGPRGRVFAFEPSPIASCTIEAAIKESRLENVTLTKAAVGKAAGNVSLYLPTTQHLHSPSILQNDPAFVPVQVPVIALDDFEPLNGAQIKLVKIDVEGYEPDVLAGMERLVRARRIENIICEFNSGWLERNSTTPAQLLERFFDLGYQIRFQTDLQRDLKGHQGERYSLQDIWFHLP